ncbi:MAG: glycosyltransferase, partial [Candidatus Nitrotoga sp.]|nr:glycosyltransferase [Candidatus Nitrotoga sp.]
MLSIIICSINPGKFEFISKNYTELLGDALFEIIGIHDAQSLCEGYNRGITQSRGDILIFCHDDIEIISPDFYPRLRQYLQVYDVVGCAGTSHLVASNWGYAGDPYLHGTVAYPVAGDEWPGNRFD